MCVFYRIVTVLLDELIARSLEPKSAKMMLRRSVNCCMSLMSVISRVCVMSLMSVVLRTDNISQPSYSVVQQVAVAALITSHLTVFTTHKASVSVSVSTQYDNF